MKREDFEPNIHSKICSEHFEENSFSFQPFSGRRRLKSDAVPTKFSFKVERKREINSYQLRRKENEDPSVSQNLSGKRDAETQTTDDFVSALLELNSKLQQELNDAKLKIDQMIFRFESISGDDILKYLTGFDRVQFKVMFSFLCLEECLVQESSLTPINQFFLLFVYLRTGITQIILAHLFQIQQPQVSKICTKLAEIIYKKIKNISIWPTKRQIQEHMPFAFCELYPQCRVIIDCTEFPIQRPSKPTIQQASFSYYKNVNTLKAMVGITPSGAICFISDLWSGCISDKELFLKSGMLSLLEEGDLVLADRSFIISKELEKKGCQLLMPHFLANEIQFSADEKFKNECVAHHRVHIERAIGRIKNFKYFEGTISNSSINIVNKYFYIVSFFINFTTPLINPIY